MREKMKKSLILSSFVCFSIFACAIEVVHIDDPRMWNCSALASYVGQTVEFDVPMYILNHSASQLSPYRCAVMGAANVVSCSGIPNPSGYHRLGEYCTKLRVYVNSTTSVAYRSGTFDGNTRQAILKGPDMDQIDAKGEHDLLVCAANLEYYLVNNLGTGYGPDSKKQHEEQRTKTKQAMALINADIYGFCEIEQGTAALKEICADMNTAHKDRYYTYVNNGTSSAAGSYTMSAFVYDTMRVRAIGECRKNNTEVLNRKYMQCFQYKANRECFIFSMNHFKAMSGGGDTESRRIAEANSINSEYEKNKVYYDEEDLLIMGDLNCYYGSEPITILLQDGERTDLHRYFHPEGSYSYVFSGAANYLDHAICNLTLLPQVTGMQAYHVNSDEKDCYTYDGYCNDGTMFRYSDHDPVLVGLKLSSTTGIGLVIVNEGENLKIRYGEGGYVRVYDLSGNLCYQQSIDWDDYTVTLPTSFRGCFVVHVFHNGKNNVTKYIRP